MTVIGDNIVVAVVKSRHRCHHLTACRVLGLVTSFGPIKDREVVLGVILDIS
jgi:molybdopterin synthase catalytic subunit